MVQGDAHAKVRFCTIGHRSVARDGVDAALSPTASQRPNLVMQKSQGKREGKRRMNARLSPCPLAKRAKVCLWGWCMVVG